jgi:acetyltransferase-like isoleucine patch superfamily enzyme
MPGVTIGDYCIIGANSVVTRDIPMGCIVAGVPAKILKQYSQEEIESLKSK